MVVCIVDSHSPSLKLLVRLYLNTSAPLPGRYILQQGYIGAFNLENLDLAHAFRDYKPHLIVLCWLDSSPLLPFNSTIAIGRLLDSPRYVSSYRISCFSSWQEVLHLLALPTKTSSLSPIAWTLVIPHHWRLNTVLSSLSTWVSFPSRPIR